MFFKWSALPINPSFFCPLTVSLFFLILARIFFSPSPGFLKGNSLALFFSWILLSVLASSSFPSTLPTGFAHLYEIYRSPVAVLPHHPSRLACVNLSAMPLARPPKRSHLFCKSPRAPPNSHPVLKLPLVAVQSSNGCEFLVRLLPPPPLCLSPMFIHIFSLPL